MTLEELKHRAGELLALEKGYFEDYEAIKPDAIEWALKFADALIAQGAVDPFLAPLNDGTVQLEWEAGGRAFEIEFDEHGPVEIFSMVGCNHHDKSSHWEWKRKP